MEEIEEILEIVEFLPLILLTVAFGLNFFVIRKLWKGALNAVFVPFAFGIFFAALSWFYLQFIDLGMHHHAEITKSLWWHSLLYISLLSFIWGGIRLKEISTASSPKGLSKKDGVVLGAFCAYAFVVFAFSRSIEPIIGPALAGSILESLGIQHFLVFFLAVMASSTMFYIKEHWGRLLSSGANPILGFLALMGVQHLWELLTESWQVVKLDHELIELVEQAFAIPGAVLIVLAMVKIALILRRDSKPAPVKAAAAAK